ncbi:hypothetical protein [Sorangium sp. So ce1099]|uniref:hypothetical protein n=1 Tax=Sorangium sp. So ce1099 TaxID=3133331 RepID=UPI003F616AEE
MSVATDNVRAASAQRAAWIQSGSRAGSCPGQGGGQGGAALEGRAGGGGARAAALGHVAQLPAGSAGPTARWVRLGPPERY